jgi:hypothetical protein
VSTELDPEEVVTQVTTRLSERYPDLKAGEVERVVRAELANLIDRPVQDYLAVLTERAAKKQLKKDR